MRPQAFIPIWSPGYGMTHLVAVPLSDFDPLPPTLSIGTGVYNTRLVPMRQVNPRSRNAGLFELACIEFSDREVKLGQNSVPGAVPLQDVLNFGRNFTVRGQHIEVRAILDWVTNMFTYGAPFYGENVPGGVVPVTPPSGTTNTTWSVTTPFASSAACQFYDLNWVGPFESSFPGYTAVSIAVSPPSDPSVASALKVFVVQSVGFGSVVVGGTSPSADTLRFIKTTATPLPSGSHLYSATVSAKTADGIPVSIPLTIELIL